MDFDGNDIDTPRGVSAKEEVKKLRAVVLQKSQDMVLALAKVRFHELDKDHNGFLEKDELKSVVHWVMSTYTHDGKMSAKDEEVESRIMGRLDANKDGKLDEAEFETLFIEMMHRKTLLERAVFQFKKFDTDKSGMLEAKEIDDVITWALSAFPGDHATYKSMLLKEIDSNGDGKLDLTEFTVLFEDMLAREEMIKRAVVKFRELDADNSGFLETAELDKVADWVLDSYIEQSRDDRDHFKSSLVDRMDKNKDGKLDLKEFTELFIEILQRMDLVHQATMAFKKLDTDNSGYLEKGELREVATAWALACKKETGIDIEVAIGEMLNSVDYNSDGKLELKEFSLIFQKVISENGVWI